MMSHFLSVLSLAPGSRTGSIADVIAYSSYNCWTIVYAFSGYFSLI